MGRNDKAGKSETELAVGAELAAVLPANAKPWYRTRHLLLLNLSLLVPLLSAATIGFDGSMMNGLQTLSQWRDYFGQPSGAVLGAMNAIFPVGKLVAVVPVAWLTDRFGRKLPIWVGLLGLAAATAIQASSHTVAQFIVARFFLGFFTAFVGQPAPILITELAYPTHRAKMTALYQTFFYCGSVLAAWSTYGSFRIPSTWSWRIPSLLQGAIPLLQLLGVFFVPESPRWLLANGRTSEARDILVKWHAGGDQASTLVEYEMQQISTTVELERHARATTSYLDLIRTRPNQHRTLIAFVVGFFAQWNGATVVSYYLSLVLNTIGITKTSDQALINGLLQVWNWLAAVLAGALMVDRLGRRTLFLTSVAGMFVSYVVWTVLTARFVSTLDQAMGNAVVAFIFIYYFFYDIAWSPLFIAYPVEIFEFGLRARGVAVTYGSTFAGLIIGQFVNPIAMGKIGWRYYIVFDSILAMLLVVIWFLFPETKGRTLEEIAEVFDGKSRRVADVEAELKKEPDSISEQVEHTTAEAKKV
ncbi:general substrate transporter [Achaetomium macrosporum]|uniref:General substrate transporter n=1 Tax=Achaetomium macrosporum TaxID=79813 RepID=A0AAN7C4D6_9PEZI|nr:general substrate transporter [Achaetomium macrosporum]